MPCWHNPLHLADRKQIANPTTDAIPLNDRVLDGLFQAFAVRSGGFYVVPISGLRIGLQILYILMMYVSVYPVTVTIRNTNIYEERSLGIYADDLPATPGLPETEEAGAATPGPIMTRAHRTASSFGALRRHLTNVTHPAMGTNSSILSRGYFVRQQLRSQLAHDLWWICLAILFITIIETSQFDSDPATYSVFNVIFEVVSGYGCVGMSVGLPDQAYSFCGSWHVLSKLILCAVMLRGRHRGLPVAIDRAVLLPGEYLGAAEEQDARLRAERSMASRTRDDTAV